jgi:hypothetical protein
LTRWLRVRTAVAGFTGATGAKHRCSTTPLVGHLHCAINLPGVERFEQQQLDVLALPHHRATPPANTDLSDLR